MRKLLIYIPTYKRPALLGAQLDSLKTQIGDYPQIRVVISDNDEPNKEMKSVEAWCEAEPQFHYRRNAANLGANANFSLGFCLANRDEILWLLADDTTVKAGAITNILRALETNADLYSLSRELSPKPEFIYDYGTSGLRSVLWNEPWGHISHALYNMETFASSANMAFSLHNSSFPHLAVLFEGARKRGDLRIKQLPAVDVIQDGSPPEEGLYSLSLTGMPQIFSLAPAWERGYLCRSWLWKHGAWFHRCKPDEPVNFIMTSAILREYGGIRARLLIRLTQFEAAFTGSTIGSRIQIFVRQNGALRKIMRRSE